MEMEVEMDVILPPLCSQDGALPALPDNAVANRRYYGCCSAPLPPPPPPDNVVANRRRCCCSSLSRKDVALVVVGALGCLGLIGVMQTPAMLMWFLFPRLDTASLPWTPSWAGSAVASTCNVTAAEVVNATCTRRCHCDYGEECGEDEDEWDYCNCDTCYSPCWHINVSVTYCADAPPVVLPDVATSTVSREDAQRQLDRDYRIGAVLYACYYDPADHGRWTRYISRYATPPYVDEPTIAGVTAVLSVVACGFFILYVYLCMRQSPGEVCW
jgi:hypothetical protein